MKRTIALAAAACTLAVPALAFGQTFVGIFDGHVVGTPDTSVKLKFNGAVDQQDGSLDRRVTNFVARDLVVNCDDGVVATLAHAKLKGKIVVDKNGNFRAVDNDRTEFKVNGHIGQNKAIGRFRLTGLITGTDGVVRDCDSGALAWVARP